MSDKFGLNSFLVNFHRRYFLLSFINLKGSVEFGQREVERRDSVENCV